MLSRAAPRHHARDRGALMRHTCAEHIIKHICGRFQNFWSRCVPELAGRHLAASRGAGVIRQPRHPATASRPSAGHALQHRPRRRGQLPPPDRARAATEAGGRHRPTRRGYQVAYRSTSIHACSVAGAGTSRTPRRRSSRASATRPSGRPSSRAAAMIAWASTQAGRCRACGT